MLQLNSWMTSLDLFDNLKMGGCFDIFTFCAAENVVIPVNRKPGPGPVLFFIYIYNSLGECMAC